MKPIVKTSLAATLCFSFGAATQAGLVGCSGINLVWIKDEGKQSWSALLAGIGTLAGKPSTALTNRISGLAGDE